MKQANLCKRGVIYIMGIYITGIRGVIKGVIKGVIYINSLLLILFINSLKRIHMQQSRMYASILFFQKSNTKNNMSHE